MARREREPGKSRPRPVARRAARTARASRSSASSPRGPGADRLLLELATEGIGHAAVLREPARELEAADLDLALRYLPEVRVVVVVEMPAPIVAAAAERTQWSGAALIVLGRAPGRRARRRRDLPDGAIVLEAPASDPDATFAGFVGAFAARLDAGATAADAWAATTRELAVEPVPSQLARLAGLALVVEGQDERLVLGRRTLAEGQDQPRSVVAHVVHRPADRVGLERAVLGRDEQALELARIGQRRDRASAPRPPAARRPASGRGSSASARWGRS